MSQDFSKTDKEFIQDLQKDLTDLRMQFHKVAMEARYHMCHNCKPSYCCNGMECGCYGKPMWFESTSKCDDQCLIKAFEERNSLRIKVERLSNFLNYFSKNDPEQT